MPASDHGLIGDKAHRPPFHAAKARHDIARISFLDLEEIALVHGLGDEFLDVVGLCRIVWRQRVERGLASFGVIEARPFRNTARVRRWQEIEKPPHLQQCLDVVFIGAVGHRAFDRVHGSSTEILGGHRLVGHRPHHVGAGDEHVARVLHHEDEIGERWGVDVAAGEGPMTREIWGITPDARTLRWKTSP